MSLSDQVLYCRDCNQEFIFTVGEQEFFASRGLTNTPTRCPSCRSSRRQSGGRRDSFGSQGGGSYQQREPRQMYTTVCASCGNEAQVPFQPRADRPVYCRDCYQAQPSSQRSSGGSSRGRSRW
ncbi:zinc-ribbon domain containing protein [Ktedonobacter racemifer]|uniref:Uncharacterized protein n=1 Tax=Ktedonobacter racemifer DSM 44963 TaxID=485913 RepID=D6TZF9_KTERA|nr:zinc-ribbon domain containing protein [Ktedonobacter racemifer]EFH81949.1 conserved hypothetical protein [Ktedonobacter racemifer DSM 44963]